MRENKALHTLRAGRPVMTVGLSFVNAGLAEYLLRLGYECLMLDTEHNGVDDRDVLDILRVCEPAGASLLMHMPLSDPSIQRYMALGLTGFHIAMVRSTEMARAVVDAVKFPPLGKRGLGAFRSIDYGMSVGNWPDYIAKSNAETFISVSIEDTDGLAAAPEFAKIPEIDVLQVATSDLSSSLGVPGQNKHEKVVQANAKVVALAQAAGKAAGIAVGSPDEMREASARGSRFMIVQAARLVRVGADAFLSTYKDLGKEK